MPLPDEFHELAARVRNWGRWGPDDELGTLNLIDPAARRRGADCIRDGRTFSLAKERTVSRTIFSSSERRSSNRQKSSP